MNVCILVIYATGAALRFRTMRRPLKRRSTTQSRWSECAIEWTCLCCEYEAVCKCEVVKTRVHFLWLVQIAKTLQHVNLDDVIAEKREWLREMRGAEEVERIEKEEAAAQLAAEEEARLAAAKKEEARLAAAKEEEARLAAAKEEEAAAARIAAQKEAERVAAEVAFAAAKQERIESAEAEPIATQEMAAQQREREEAQPLDAPAPGKEVLSSS